MNPKIQVNGILLLALTMLFSGCICQDYLAPSTGKNVAPGGEVVCNQPYIQVGDGCCLDRDGNDVCDRDEAATQTTLGGGEVTLPSTTIIPPTTTLRQTTTTIGGPACNMNKDCGEPNTYAKCYNGNVIMVTETPACTNPGKPSAKCEWKSKTSPYQTCDEWEACFHGECVNETEITCKDACLDKGYGSWYCYQSSSCKGSDVWAALGDGRCMEDLGGPGHEDWYCCCEADSAVTTTTMLGVSTTTTTSPLSHKACVGTVCKKVSGPGINTCSTDLDCMAFEFHKECVGSMCESVFGKGLNECMTNAQCLALTETTLGHKVYHRECKGTSCMLVVGAGANECTSSIQCMSKFDITATTLHIGPDLGDLL